MTTFRRHDDDGESVRRVRGREIVVHNLFWLVGTAAILLLAAVIAWARSRRNVRARR